MEALVMVLTLFVIAEAFAILFLFHIVSQHQRGFEVLVKERRQVVASTAIRLVRP